MRRLIPILAIALCLSFLASAPQASAWVYRTHGHQATNAFDALPDLYKENLDSSMLYSAAIAPDDWARDQWGPNQDQRADNLHRFTWCKQRASYWLRRARDNYAAGNYDNALYAMGIAAHYIGDAMCAVHNDNIWNKTGTFGGENSAWIEEHPSGWSRHEHFEEQQRYHEPGWDRAAKAVVIRPKNWLPTLEAYITWMESYLDNFARDVQQPYLGYPTVYHWWLATRDCSFGRSSADNAAQLIYDAWYSMLYELLGSPGGPGFASVEPAPEGGSQPTWVLPAIAFLALVPLKRGRPRRRVYRPSLRSERRGVSPVVGAFIVISLLIIASTTIISRWVPEEERVNEAEHVDEVFETWQALQRAISAGENRTFRLRGDAKPANVLGLFGRPTLPGRITIIPARNVVRIPPENDTYVEEGSAASYGGEGSVWVRSSPSTNRRSYLRFNLSTLPADAAIEEARLYVYAHISKFPNTWQGVTGYSSVPALIEVRPVENDAWDETIHWFTAPAFGDVLRNDDWPWDNCWELSYDLAITDDNLGMWYTFNLTSHVKRERADNRVSLALKAVKENSKLERYARIVSKENSWTFLHHHLLVVYRSASLENTTRFDRWGAIADPGYISFDVQNQSYDDYTFTFEGGGVIKQRYGTGDLMAAGPGLVVGERAEGDNIKITVNRYRILGEEKRFSVSGDIVVKVSVEENTSLRRDNNLDNLVVAIRTTHPRSWRGEHPLTEPGHFTELAARFPGSWGSLDYLLEAWESEWRGGAYGIGEIVLREFYLNGITILGKRRGVGVGDILYSERVYDVRIEVTLA